MADEQTGGVRIAKVSGTGVAAAAANLFWYSGYLPVLLPEENAIILNFNTAVVLLVLGIALAFPLDRLIRFYWPVSTLQQAVEMSAIMAVTTAMVVHPGTAELGVDSFVESAVRAVHVFTVLVPAILVNISIN